MCQKEWYLHYILQIVNTVEIINLNIMKYKTLLTLINFAKDYEKHADYAARLACDLNLKLILLHVYNSGVYPFGSASSINGGGLLYAQSNILIHKKSADKKLKELAVRLNRSFPDLLIDTIISEDFELSAVKDLIENDEADMLLTANNQYNSMFSVNADSYELIHEIDCPIWIIPENHNYNPLKQIVYATDYKSEDIKTITDLVELTGSFNPHISALHITDDPGFESKIKKEGFRDILVEKTAYKNLEVINALTSNSGNIGELLDEYASKNKVDLIVALRENRNFLDRLFKVSTTKKLVTKSHIPILIYHEVKVREKVQ